MSFINKLISKDQKAESAGGVKIINKAASPQNHEPTAAPAAQANTKSHQTLPQPTSHAPATSTTAANTTLSSKKKKFKLSDFDIMRTLGTGSFGRVHLVRLKETGKYYAMKVLRKSEVVRLKQVEHTINEKHILDIIQFPFLVHMLGSFQDNANLYMVLEYVVGGELFTYLRKATRFSDRQAKIYAAEVVVAFEYMHSHDFIYRDLKPENLLLDSKGHIKITDFGFAKYVPEVTYTLCGTPDYLAPEIIQSKAYGKPVDWWSLGVLIYEMLAGYPPFYDEEPFKLYEKILTGKVKYPTYFDPNAKDLIKKLLSLDITKRYGNLRAGVQDIKKHKWFSDIDWDKLVALEIPAPFTPPSHGEGDTSNFDQYAEDHEPYGVDGPDPHKALFVDF